MSVSMISRALFALALAALSLSRSSRAEYVDEVLEFQQAAAAATAGSRQGLDKIHRKHAYQVMYGLFLMPLIRERRAAGAPVRMLEIGLGCIKGAGAQPTTLKKSVHVWASLLDGPGDHVAVAEYKSECARDWQARGIIPRAVQLVTGDQANADDVRRWARETGGRFDAVVDDGGHAPSMILASFDELWPHVNPGGLYFVEDLEVNRRSQERLARLTMQGDRAAHAKAARDPALLANGTVFIDVIDDWIDQLLAPGGEMKRRVVHRIPDGVRWIMCQNHACVIAKCKEDDVAHCSGRFGR